MEHWGLLIWSQLFRRRRMRIWKPVNDSGWHQNYLKKAGRQELHLMFTPSAWFYFTLFFERTQWILETPKRVPLTEMVCAPLVPAFYYVLYLCWPPSDFLGTIKDTYTAPFTKLQSVIESCFRKNPDERPDITHLFKTFCTVLHLKLNSNRSRLTTIIIRRLENYASELDEQVYQRTLELLEERRKCDDLLLEMLPRFVQNKFHLNDCSPLWLERVLRDRAASNFGSL